MWPRYETVVRLSLSWTRSRPSSSCNVATVRDRGATSTNPAQSQNLQLQCGHGTRPWCDSVSARCGHTVWVAAMWPRYETVVRPADLWLCANEDQAAMWPRYETVVRPGQVGGPDARPQAAMWPRYETVVRLGIHPAQEDGRLAAMWPRYETVVRLPVVVAGITGSGKLQCGHGTRPWCDEPWSRPGRGHEAAMWPRYETVVRLGPRPDDASPQQLQCGHGTRPWCDVGRELSQVLLPAAMWPRYETVVRRHPPNSGTALRRPLGSGIGPPRRHRPSSGGCANLEFTGGGARGPRNGRLDSLFKVRGRR